LNVIVEMKTIGNRREVDGCGLVASGTAANAGLAKHEWLQKVAISMRILDVVKE
jgi:hypothetical protein